MPKHKTDNVYYTMALQVTKASLKEISHLRNLFLCESNFQIRYNAYHERGWTDSYIVSYQNESIGYGAVKGQANANDRDTIFEFYIIPSFRNLSSLVFLELLQSSKAIYIECQSNDLLLTSLLYNYGKDIQSNVVLFKEGLFLILVVIRLFLESAMTVALFLNTSLNRWVIIFWS